MRPCPKCLTGWVYPSPEADGQVDAVCLACGWRAPPKELLPLVNYTPELDGHRPGGLRSGERRRR